MTRSVHSDAKLTQAETLPVKPSDHANPNRNNKGGRKQDILEALAQMLEKCPGERITTARLAREVGVSEAALYRHFPSKAKMFEGLIEFVEDSIFSRINLINSNDASTAEKCYLTLSLLLTFAEKNPGITRILMGDPLTGENDRLRKRVVQFFDRVETQLKQFLREAPVRDGRESNIPVDQAANLLLSIATGKICQYVRNDFSADPTTNWESQWVLLEGALFCHN